MLYDNNCHYFLQLTGVLKEAVQIATDMETNSVAVERVKEYCDVEPEVIVY